jgi:hypothetical protein
MSMCKGSLRTTGPESDFDTRTYIDGQVYIYIYEQTNGSYPFENGLNGLNGLAHL